MRDMDKSHQAKSKIPEFKTLEEMAEFWDTHDSEEFEGEFEEVEIEFVRPLTHIIEIELNEEQAHALFDVGRERNVNAIGLAREWLLERLAAETGRSVESLKREAEPEAPKKKPARRRPA